MFLQKIKNKESLLTSGQGKERDRDMRGLCQVCYDPRAAAPCPQAMKVPLACDVQEPGRLSTRGLILMQGFQAL